jgi:hypothetical protein
MCERTLRAPCLRSTLVNSPAPFASVTGPSPSSRRPSLFLALAVIALFVCPLSLRAVNRLVLTEIPAEGYLPSLELRRRHEPFDKAAIDRLRYGQPAWVFIGDSMLGTRIDPTHLGQISTTGNQVVSFLYRAATGPGWWYLAFKNQLVASGIKPRCVFFFFRDTNLTDTTWRLAGLYGRDLDWVASPSEPELDRLVAARTRGVWSRFYRAINRTYEVDVAAMWMEPLVRKWFLRWTYPDPQEQLNFDAQAEQAFGLEFLRSDVGSDLAAADNVNFGRDLPTSVLPLIMDLAEREQLHVCFVRVQRRPSNGQPPPQSPALRRYVADLAAYVQSRGASFRDDTGDPQLTLDMYADGDHVRDRVRYTEIFHSRMATLFR